MQGAYAMTGRRLRVGMLSPISWRTPPRSYGPWEQIVSSITEGLVARGHEVTLFATADSQTSGTLKAVCPAPYSEDASLDPKVWECLHIAHCFEHAEEFDIIHNNFDFLPLSYTGLVETPVVTTIHGFSSPRILPVYERYNGRAKYVAISEADRAPSLDYAATIHHGVQMADFPLRPEAEGYLLFFGRIHPDKGCAEAIAVARSLRRRLVIAGIVQDEEYFRTQIEPQLGDFITFIGAVGAADRGEVLGGASALLHLINFAEPFGLSVVEAMACGTPVIARPLGSMPEIIMPKVNGFLVQNQAEAEQAVASCRLLDRRQVRASVEQRFSVDRMMDDYVRVYEKIVDEAEATGTQPPLAAQAIR